VTQRSTATILPGNVDRRKSTDTVFLELGLSEATDRDARDTLLAWAAWYAGGNRVTDERAIDYATAAV
jgi:hypothetical protein